MEKSRIKDQNTCAPLLVADRYHNHVTAVEEDLFKNEWYSLLISLMFPETCLYPVLSDNISQKRRRKKKKEKT